MNITDDEKLMKEERKSYKEMLEVEYLIKKEENSSDFFLFLTLFLLVTAPFLLPIIGNQCTKDVYVKAYKDDVLLLEYTGKDNSVKKMNNGYSFTVDDKTYIFKDVDVIEITNLDEGGMNKCY